MGWIQKDSILGSCGGRIEQQIFKVFTVLTGKLMDFFIRLHSSMIPLKAKCFMYVGFFFAFIWADLFRIKTLEEKSQSLGSGCYQKAQEVPLYLLGRWWCGRWALQVQGKGSIIWH